MSLRNVLAAASVLLSLVVSACSNQAEGERCDRLNNDDDCQEGLVCKPGTELGSNADTCCPPGDGASELPECTRGGGAAASSGTGTGTPTTATGTATGTTVSTSTGDGGSSQGGGGGSSQGGGGASSQGGGGAGGN